MADVVHTVFVARPDDPGDLAIAEPALTIIVPAFDEARRLPVLLASLREHVDPTTTEIIVVDDGSTDGTADVAHRCGDWAPGLRVIRHDHNQGKGAAVRTGVFAAHAPVIGFVDADDATDLSALSAMIDQIGGNVGAVFGSRHAPGSTVTGSPPIRGLMGRMFNHVVRYAAGTAITDTQCGAKVFRAAAARLAFSAVVVDGFAFDVEVLRRLVALGFDVVEHPVRWHYVSGTKIRFRTPFVMLRDIVRLRLRTNVPLLNYVDASVSSALTAADPLHAVDLPGMQGSARILVPDWDAPRSDQIAERLGTGATTGRTNEWLAPPR